MKKTFAALLITGLVFVGSSALASCNSKDECISKGKKALSAKHYEKAMEYFKKAIQLDPKNEKAWKYYNRAFKQMIVNELGEEEGC